MLMPASITYPVGNTIGSFTSNEALRFSLQWMRVSSKSNITVFLSIWSHTYSHIPSAWQGLVFWFGIRHRRVALRARSKPIFAGRFEDVLSPTTIYLCRLALFQRHSRCCVGVSRGFYRICGVGRVQGPEWRCSWDCWVCCRWVVWLAIIIVVGVVRPSSFLLFVSCG